VSRDQELRGNFLCALYIAVHIWWKQNFPAPVTSVCKPWQDDWNYIDYTLKSEGDTHTFMPDQILCQVLVSLMQSLYCLWSSDMCKFLIWTVFVGPGAACFNLIRSFKVKYYESKESNALWIFGSDCFSFGDIVPYSLPRWS